MSAGGGAECRWQVHGLNLAGLAWGDPDGAPVLCLHGWMDNAASFAALASALHHYRLVAPDLTGQGRSDHRSPDATYQIWDDLPQLVGLVDALGWERFRLIGHSRGAIISALLAAAFPERVQQLVMLDALAPEPVPESEFPRQMRRFVLDKQRLLGSDNRLFTSIEEAVASRQEQGIGDAAARLLAERNIRPGRGGYTWTTDPRLKGASAVKLSAGQIEAVLRALDMPVLFLLAAGGYGGRHPELLALARRCIHRLELEQVAGGHHFHMESGAGDVAGRIEEFFRA
jgi:pimeloyl-ACP methyl ester carboxylesterase